MLGLYLVTLTLNLTNYTTFLSICFTFRIRFLQNDYFRYAFVPPSLFSFFKEIKMSCLQLFILILLIMC